MVPKILLIEDEPSIADNILYALRTEGMEVVWRSTAREGLLALKESAFALLVLDVGLPDGNGFEVCRELRSRSRVPIIFVTARKDEIDRVVGLELGADDYIVKPFSPRELAARVRAVLRRTEGSIPEEAAAVEDREGASPAGPFALNEERREIRFRGRALPLSRYEYQLLVVFLSHPGRVFTRDELMERAWDDPGASLDRTVDAHVKSIRAKLRTIHPDADPIRTCRGIGYSLVALP